jgi:hypothetical protein
VIKKSSVKNKPLILSLGAVIASTIILFSCKKINEATELGGGLIPPIDNIHTFDTTLLVEAYNDSFTILNDSTRSFKDDEFFLGLINNDPLFGKTDAKMHLQLKPNFFKYTFLNKPDSLFIDSVVLVMSYVETYGDTTIPQTINVYEIDQASNFKYDSNYLIRQTAVINGPLLGSRTFAPSILNDSIKAFQDTTINQMRIRLENSFGQRLLSYDTTGNDAYVSDSLFNTKFKGFALESVSGGNAIMGFNISGANTKLAIYYRYNDKSPTDLDTTVAYWTFSGNLASAAANYVKRDYSGSPFAASVGGAAPDDHVYIQNTPGTYATLKIPGLAGLSNRIVHRAELVAEQVYHPSDTMFTPPPIMFLQAEDPTITGTDPKFRNIPYDFVFDISGNFDYSSFGAFPFRTLDPANNSVNAWHFNLTRYVQNIVNGKEPVYPSYRLLAPVETSIMYRFNAQSESVKRLLAITGTPAKGRVRLAGGNHPTIQKMRVRIVYSKI